MNTSSVDANWIKPFTYWFVAITLKQVIWWNLEYEIKSIDPVFCARESLTFNGNYLHFNLNVKKTSPNIIMFITNGRFFARNPFSFRFAFYHISRSYSLAVLKMIGTNLCYDTIEVIVFFSTMSLRHLHNLDLCPKKKKTF